MGNNWIGSQLITLSDDCFQYCLDILIMDKTIIYQMCCQHLGCCNFRNIYIDLHD
jgi:hypothetical protein